MMNERQLVFHSSFIPHHSSLITRGFEPMGSTDGAEACRRKFLRAFPGGFRDETYLDWERDYKWEIHERWQAALAAPEFTRLLKAGEFCEIAARAVRVEQRARHPMVFSFEKMA